MGRGMKKVDNPLLVNGESFGSTQNKEGRTRLWVGKGKYYMTKIEGGKDETLPSANETPGRLGGQNQIFAARGGGLGNEVARPPLRRKKGFSCQEKKKMKPNTEKRFQ